jgi:uncharacterized protein (TIGR03066 family)
MKLVRIVALVGCFGAWHVLVNGSGSALLAQGKDNTAEKLVGKWEVSKSAGDLPIGATVEFTKDGKLIATLKADDQEIKLEGTYKVEKDKILVKVKVGEEMIEEAVIIKKLTNTELEIEDKEAKVTTFKKK